MTSAQRDGLKDAALALTEPMIDDLVKDISRRIRDGGDATGYQTPFNVHYTGVKTKGTFNVETKTFTATGSGG
ncbi:MAG: hypothetical protein PUC95_06525 [Gemmiger formicilis]|nr:hypothetical protein [Gemmiger formicilis]